MTRSALPDAGPIQFGWLLYLILGVLAVGPLIGPLFASIGWTVLSWINWPIYLMGENVCPQPALTIQVLGYPMVVCSRCWAAVFGLWTVLILYKTTGHKSFWRMWLQQPEILRVAIAIACFWPWIFDIIGSERLWWATGHPLLMASGFFGGLGAGALLIPMAAKRSGAAKAAGKVTLAADPS